MGLPNLNVTEQFPFFTILTIATNTYIDPLFSCHSKNVPFLQIGLEMSVIRRCEDCEVGEAKCFLKDLEP